MSLQIQLDLARGEAVPCDLVAFQSETIALVPCMPLRHPFRAGPVNPVAQRMTPVLLRQIHARLVFLLLTSSISCSSRLPLRFHHDRVPSRSSVRAWTPLKAPRTGLPLPLKHFAKRFPKPHKLSAPCFLPRLQHPGPRLYLLRQWVLQERR